MIIYSSNIILAGRTHGSYRGICISHRRSGTSRSRTYCRRTHVIYLTNQSYDTNTFRAELNPKRFCYSTKIQRLAQN